MIISMAVKKLHLLFSFMAVFLVIILPVKRNIYEVSKCGCINRGHTPSWQQLDALDITTGIKERITTYDSLGLCLFNDESIMETIKQDNKVLGGILDDIFDHWIHGQGQESKINTWETLVDCLRFAELYTLADEMEAVLRFCDDHGEKLCILERSNHISEISRKPFHTVMTDALLAGSAVLAMTYNQLKTLFLSDIEEDLLLPQGPVVTKQPQNQNVVYGDLLTLSVAVTGPGMLSYQWLKDGVPITDDHPGNITQYNTSILHINSFTPKHEGSYSCIVNNQVESVQSNAAKIIDVSPLKEIHQEGYICAAHSAVGFVYIPATINFTNFEIKSMNDVNMYPKTTANDVILTPVVSITPGSDILPASKPIVIELMKTAQILDSGDRNFITMFNSNNRSSWRELSRDCDVLDDRIRFKTTHFSYFTVIVRFSPPTASIKVNPNVSDTESQVVQLTVPELPRFQVQIPSKSVQSATEVKATLYYDDSQVCNNQLLATACVMLEPHGQQFTENVLVHVPIPGYSKIVDANPNSKVQLFHSLSNSSDDDIWVPYEDMKIEIIGRDFVATFSVNHFSTFKLIWEGIITGVPDAINIFKHVESLSGRVQVFMSRETRVNSEMNFSIQVLVYHFQDSPQEIPVNYRYNLYDSGKLPIEFQPGMLYFIIMLKDTLSEKNNQSVFIESYELSKEYAARAEFNIDVIEDNLGEESVLGFISINDSKSYRLKNHSLIKPNQKEECSTDDKDVHEGQHKKSYIQTVMDGAPTMPQLIQLERKDGGNPVRIKENIGDKLYDFGILLLNDESGKKMETIKANSIYRHKGVIDNVFTEWIDGKDPRSPVTWKVLIDNLRKVELNALADEIIDALKTY